MKQEQTIELGGVEVVARVYPPTVTVRNNIFPPEEELQNCRTCHRGRKLPADTLSDEDYHYRCTWDVKTHIGLRNYDNDCGNYVRKRRD